MCNLCNLFKVNNVWIRIAEGLNVDCLCVLVNCVFKCAFLIGVNKGCCNSVSRESVFKKVVRTAVDCLCGYDDVACFCERLNCVCNSRRTRGNCKSRRAALKSRYSLLKNILRRVCQSAVDVACVLEGKTVCGVLAVMKNVRSCCINRNCSCVCYGVGLFLTCVKLNCFKL